MIASNSVLVYCRFGNFCENFFFANSIKRHISDVKNSRLRQDLPISINDSVILPICEGFAKFCEKKFLFANKMMVTMAGIHKNAWQKSCLS